MTVSLGGIALSEHLVLDIAPAAVGYSQRRLIGGASVVQVDGSTGGRTLTLSGKNHWTMAQADQLRAIASAGLTVTLIHHRGVFNVVIVGTAELTAMRPYHNPLDSDRYTGSITMIEV